MEEPSLFIRVNITKINWDNFLNSRVKNLKDFTDWKQWLNEEKKMYGDSNSFIDNWSIELKGNVKDNLGWMYIEYNEKEEELILSNLFFYINYEPMLQVIAVLRGISEFIIPNTQNNFLVVYPYWWGDREEVGKWANVYIEFDNGKSFLTNKLNKVNIDLATAYFNAKDEEWAEKCYKEMND